MNIRRFAALFLLVAAILALSQLAPLMMQGILPGSPALAVAGPAESKSLSRLCDAVILSNAVLQGAIDGTAVAKIRVLAFRGGRLEAIPFQVDERGPAGDHILTQGPLQGKERDPQGNYHDAAQLGVFNGLDEIVCMARDLGDRAPAGQGLEAAQGFLEIQATDPVDGGRAWGYLATLTAPPPLSPIDYIDYRVVTGHKNRPEVHLMGSHYHAAFSDPDKPVAQSDWQIRKGTWEGRDFMEIFRSIIDIRIGFIHFDVTQDNIIPKRLGQIDGPVRVVRRIRNSARLAGIPVPDFLLKKLSGATLDTDSFYYPDYFYFNGKLSVPAALVRYGDKSKSIFTTDFNSRAVGMLWSNEKNATVPVLVDGVMSPQEHSLDTSLYQWSLLSGEEGGWMNILTFEEGFRHLSLGLYYMDNTVDGHRPEGDPPAAVYGSTGYRVKDFQKIQGSKPLEFTTNLFAADPGFGTAEVEACLKVIFRPLEVAVTSSH